ncbi:MAG TPA: chorismate mutase [Candidatus Limnocylindria bacterium]|nr:chorismate mutase [Candidatus Limnocylindria bacterium]
MATRGIRGATTVERNDRTEILRATRELLEVLVRLNGLRSEDIAYAWFTVTADLDAEFPAFAAREIGWTEVPLMCGQEIPVPGAIAGCIRVLIDWNTAKTQHEVRHAFLHRAKELRPAWAVEV